MKKIEVPVSNMMYNGLYNSLTNKSKSKLREIVGRFFNNYISLENIFKTL